MASVVNTNVMSINAQRQLGKSQATQNEAMERLSSGLRINSAKDDAAGLAISTGFQSQITGINQAVRNANDGVSMTQTAEGSMDEMTNILQRMRELSVQSANDTNSSSNRAAIQEEVDQLHSELDRIAETTEYNGTKLLDGSSGETTLQIGANSGQTLSFSIDSVTTNDLGLNGNLNKEDVNGGRVTGGTNIAASSIDINGVSIGAYETSKDFGNAAGNMANVINEKTAETGVTASAYNVVQGDAIDTLGSVPSGITSGMIIKVGDGAATTLGATSSMDNLVDTINRDIEGVTASLGDKGELLLTNDTGASVTVTGDTQGAGMTKTKDAGEQKGFLALKSADGSSISVNDHDEPKDADVASKFGFSVTNGADSIMTSAFAVSTDGITAADGLQINGVDLIATTATDLGKTVSAINALTEQTGVTATANSTEGIQFSSVDGSAIEITSNANTQSARDDALTRVGLSNEMGGKSIDALGTNVSTMAGAMSSIDKIDEALSKISDSRAGLGAIQNRLASTISNLENVSQNLSASNSRIQDADFASETSKMSKAQILQQAGTSMLSQANASAQSVLSLLG